MSRQPYRQGDVLLEPVATIPLGAIEQPRDRGRLVIAYGEVTGHSHVIDAPASEATILTTRENERFLRLVTAAPLVHEEHGTILVEPGLYRLPPQVEATDDDEPIRVLD